MPDAPRSESPTRRRAAGALFLLLLVAVGFSIARRLGALEDRVGVILDPQVGSIRIAGTDRGAASVQWLAEPAETHLVFIPAEIPPGEGWDEIASKLLPGRRVVLIERPTVTRQSSGDREVLALRALLVLEDAGGRREPALGIGTGIQREGDASATSARTVVQLIGADGHALRIDGVPLFNDRPASLLDRLRGVPPHVVRFELAVVAEDDIPASPERGEAPGGSGEPRAAGPKPLDGEEALRAIEKLKQERPERGVIPPPAPAPMTPEAPTPAPGSSERPRG